MLPVRAPGLDSLVGGVHLGSVEDLWTLVKIVSGKKGDGSFVRSVMFKLCRL